MTYPLQKDSITKTCPKIERDEALRHILAAKTK